MSSSSYYFWKWAENDLPGVPKDVHAALLRGESHPAIQAFDPGPLIQALEREAARGRDGGQEWGWKTVLDGGGPLARFVFVTGPDLNRCFRTHPLLSADLGDLELAACCEATGHILDGTLPKRNVVTMGPCPEERIYDIAEADLPCVLRRVTSDHRDAFLILTDRRWSFVQFYAHEDRYVVEWRDNHGLSASDRFEQWRALDPARFAGMPDYLPGKTYPSETDPNLVAFEDMASVFRAFLRGEPRPGHLEWCLINDILP